MGIVTLLLIPLYIIICIPVMLFVGFAFKARAKIKEDLDEQVELANKHREKEAHEVIERNESIPSPNLPQVSQAHSV